MKTNTLPAGLFMDSTAEFFAANDRGYCLFEGKRQHVSALPSRIKMAIVDFYTKRAGAERAYEAMVGKCTDAKIEQCVKCMFANFDNTPDLCADGILTPEVVSCAMRGACKFEGVGCLPASGLQKLSPAQKRVAKISYLSGKEIADTLYISTNTVKRHLQDAMQLTGARNSKELTMMVAQSGLLN